MRAIATFFDSYEIEVEIETSGASALARLATLPAIDAVLCDLHLDDFDGRDLYRQACARSPKLRARFVFMMGDRSSPPHGLTDEFSAVHVLPRPFEPERLLAVVRDVLNLQPPRAEA